MRENNPDIFVHSVETVFVDDAHMLVGRQLRKSVAGGKKIFIIEFSHMTHEAQNALLKVFEEPTADTHFFLLTEHGHALLPTLRSRLSTFETEEGALMIPYIQEAKNFLTQSVGERMKEITPFVEDKNKDGALALLNALEVVLQKTFAKDPLSIQEFLKDLEHYRAYLHDRSPSLKLILEYVALRCPQVK